MDTRRILLSIAVALVATAGRAASFECEARPLVGTTVYAGSGATEVEAKAAADAACKAGGHFVCYVDGCNAIADGRDTVTTVDGVKHGLGLIHKAAVLQGLGEQHVVLAGCDNLPADFDLRDVNTVPPVRDQGQCGSCWAHSETASLESATLASGGAALDLSEQELVSCDRDNDGCGGGNLNGFKYQISHGQGLEKDFPYTASDERCQQVPVAAKGIDYAMVGQAGRTAKAAEVQCALYKSHTIPWVTVSAGGGNWNNPPTSDMGVFSRCGGGQTNHAVGIVGWHTVGGKLYFIMRNSWGPSWGSTGGRPGAEKGYALMPLGCDSLGEEVGYIITKATPVTPPHVKLPVNVTIEKGDSVLLGVQAEDSVSYQWSTGGVDIAGATNATYEASPTVDTVYKLTGKNAAGSTESSVKVTIATFN